MAYSSLGLYQVGPGGKGPRMWVYSSTDTIATVSASGYFSNGDLVGLAAGDIITLINTTTLVSTVIIVTSVISAGAATAGENSVSQELTATGAVSGGVQSVELNHASVVIAATIASAQDHAGIFVVVDTSASGTAAHTCTLTAGTWDGTNTIATLNAPKEALVVWFDSAGNGTIVENVGTVGLS